MAKIFVYTTPSCPYCVSAKKLLNEKKLAFEEIDVSRDDDKRAWLRKITGRTTVPQIFIKLLPIGGFDELNALNQSGELDRMIKNDEE